MEATSAHAVQHHVRKYIIVFLALLGLTILTVTVSYLHLEITTAIVVALLIASVKGSLVASYFMHLISERKAIILMLIATVFFFAVLMALPLFAHSDQVRTTYVP
jgi:cytochrome c oxidase subunit 4